MGSYDGGGLSVGHLFLMARHFSSAFEAYSLNREELTCNDVI